MTKKVISIVLAVLMIMTCLPFAISAQTTDFSDYKAITNAAELKAIENNMAGKYYLANDISTSGNWLPIGWIGSEDVEFSGVLDGNGFTISGLNYSDNGSTNVGLFAIIGTNGTVCNLTINMNDFGGYANVGAIAGRNNGTISNCAVKADVICAYGKDGSVYGNAGGIAGRNNGTIVGCLSDVNNVSAYYYAGGIAGSNYGTIKECKTTSGVNTDFTNTSSDRGYAGGIAGRSNGTINDCVVSGTNVRGTVYIATIVGRQYTGGTISKIITIDNIIVWVANKSQYYSLGVGKVESGSDCSDIIAVTDSGKMPSPSTGISAAATQADVNDYIENNFDPSVWTNVDGEPAIVTVHEWDNGVTTTEATCVDDGLMTFTCKVCGEVKTKIIPAKGHKIITDEAVAPTCSTVGKTEGSHCLVCGEVIVAQEEVATIPHTVVTDEAVAPTCTEKGLTEGSHCSVCGEVIVAQEEIDALGHSFGDWAETKAPTLKETGVETRICSLCGEAETRDIPMLPSADLTAANAALDEAKALLDSADSYTKKTIADLTKAIADLEAAIADAPLPLEDQEAIDSVVADLKTAINDVTPAANMNDITDKIHELEEALNDEDITDSQRKHIADELDAIKDAADYNEETCKAEADLSVAEGEAVNAQITELSSYVSSVIYTPEGKKVNGFFGWIYNLIVRIIEFVRNVTK